MINKLPTTLVPSVVNIVRLPVNVVGNLIDSYTPMTSPTVKLSTGKTKLILELVFNNIPVKGIGKSCYQDRIDGFNEVWNFIDYIKNYKTFTIDTNHKLFDIGNMDLLLSVLDNNLYRWWNVVEFTEEQITNNSSSFSIKILESGLCYKTIVTEYDTPIGLYLNKQDLGFNSPEHLVNANQLDFEPADLETPKINSIVDITTIPGNVPVTYDVPEIEGSVRITYDVPEMINEMISDNYQYNYQSAEMYRIMN